MDIAAESDAEKLPAGADGLDPTPTQLFHTKTGKRPRVDSSDANYKEVDDTPFEHLEVVGINTLEDNLNMVNVSTVSFVFLMVHTCISGPC